MKKEPARHASAGRNAALAALALLTLLALAPPALFMAAGSVADAFGCRLDEGSAHPCLIGARDVGDTLYAASVLGGWLSLLTAPVLPVAAAIWSWIAIRWLRRP